MSMVKLNVSHADICLYHQVLIRCLYHLTLPCNSVGRGLQNYSHIPLAITGIMKALGDTTFDGILFVKIFEVLPQVR